MVITCLTALRVRCYSPLIGRRLRMWAGEGSGHRCFLLRVLGATAQSPCLFPHQIVPSTLGIPAQPSLLHPSLPPCVSGSLCLL